MGFRFRKSIKIAPGVKLNLNKKSAGLTFGGKGFHYTVNSKGKRTTSVGIPGTGLSYSSTTGGKTSEKKAYSENNFINETEGVEKKSKKKGCLPAIIISLVIVGIIGSCGTDGTDTSSTTVQTTASDMYTIEEVTTAPSTVPVIAVVTTDAETATETTAVATTTEKETTTAKTTTQKETTTENTTTTKKAETTKKESTTEKKTTQKATTTKKPATTQKETTKKVTTTKKPTTTKKKVVTTKKSSYVATDARYVLNTNSKKFHYPSCHSAAKISAENYAEFNGTREEAIKKGYSPCGNCDP